ncbi:MAG: EAL domain-containing protein [Candidatus Izemoplasmatales bacterium]|jgi:EAL domain-containing protein (putative c-di-GMP-specific phosphodiesterase class I)|nr:EAL domain-containing protein [Candidatus Izemoplasmatales bacterium]
MIKLKQFLKRYHRLAIAIFILISVPSIYAVVYFTGGIKYVYSHTMYIPILLAGIFFGFKSGLLVGLIGGILLGPLMPIDVVLNEQQEFINWFYRMIIFLSIGGLSGYFSNYLRKINKINEHLFAYNIETDVPNINYLISLEPESFPEKCTVLTILINNKNHIIEVLGLDFYHKTLFALYQKLTSDIPQPNCVIQAENDKLWVVYPKQAKFNIIDNFDHEISVSNIKVYIDYSIGIASAMNLTQCKNLSVFKDSDQLATYAKANNIPYTTYDKTILKEKYQFDLLSLFSAAIVNKELFMVYQPVVKSENEVTIFEALIRWKNEAHGLIMPNDFIPLVESTQLIHQMTDFVIEEVFKKQLELKNQGINVSLSINLSVKNLYSTDFCQRVNKLLEKYKIIPNEITFEITETMLLLDNAQLKTNITKLKEKGFKIAIDDFGKGYSSMSYLCQYPLDYIKIDRFFINDLEDNKSQYEIVNAMVKLSHQLNLQVVAEGIETKKIFSYIRDMGCDFYQGYYVSRPLDADKMVEWYNNYTMKA